MIKLSANVDRAMMENFKDLGTHLAETDFYRGFIIVVRKQILIGQHPEHGLMLNFATDEDVVARSLRSNDYPVIESGFYGTIITGDRDTTVRSAKWIQSNGLAVIINPHFAFPAIWESEPEPVNVIPLLLAEL